MSAEISPAGKVKRLVNIVEGHGSEDWFMVEGFLSINDCKSSDGMTILRIKNEGRGSRMYSTLLGAKMAGYQVRVGIDPTKKDALNYCYANHIEIIVD